MLFIKSYILKFFVSENKNTEYLTPATTSTMFSNVNKFIKLTSNSTQNAENTKSSERQKKLVFQKNG